MNSGILLTLMSLLPCFVDALRVDMQGNFNGLTYTNDEGHAYQIYFYYIPVVVVAFFGAVLLKTGCWANSGEGDDEIDEIGLDADQHKLLMLTENEHDLSVLRGDGYRDDSGQDSGLDPEL